MKAFDDSFNIKTLQNITDPQHLEKFFSSNNGKDWLKKNITQIMEDEETNRTIIQAIDNLKMVRLTPPGILFPKEIDSIKQKYQEEKKKAPGSNPIISSQDLKTLQIDTGGVNRSFYVFSNPNNSKETIVATTYKKHDATKKKITKTIIGEGAEGKVAELQIIAPWNASKQLVAKIGPLYRLKHEQNMNLILGRAGAQNPLIKYKQDKPTTIKSGHYEDTAKAIIIITKEPGFDAWNYAHGNTGQIPAPDKISYQDGIKAILTLVESLLAAHQKGILHTDLKLENCMFDPETKTMQFIDLGMAINTKDKNDPLWKSFHGTRAYLDPQLLAQECDTQGHFAYSIQSDIYAFARGIFGPFLLGYYQQQNRDTQQFEQKQSSNDLTQIYQEYDMDDEKKNQMGQAQAMLKNLMLKMTKENREERSKSLTEVRDELISILKNVYPDIKAKETLTQAQPPKMTVQDSSENKLSDQWPKLVASVQEVRQKCETALKKNPPKTQAARQQITLFIKELDQITGRSAHNSPAILQNTLQAKQKTFATLMTTRIKKICEAYDADRGWKFFGRTSEESETLLNTLRSDNTLEEKEKAIQQYLDTPENSHRRLYKILQDFGYDKKIAATIELPRVTKHI